MPEPRHDMEPQGEDLLPLRFTRSATAATLYVAGELDVATVPTLERAVAGALDEQGGEFRLDLSALTFMDSTGARALLQIHQRVELLGRRLVVVSPTEAVRRVFELMGLSDILDVRG